MYVLSPSLPAFKDHLKTVLFTESNPGSLPPPSHCHHHCRHLRTISSQDWALYPKQPWQFTTSITLSPSLLAFKNHLKTELFILSNLGSLPPPSHCHRHFRHSRTISRLCSLPKATLEVYHLHHIVTITAGIQGPSQDCALHPKQSWQFTTSITLSPSLPAFKNHLKTELFIQSNPGSLPPPSHRHHHCRHSRTISRLYSSPKATTPVVYHLHHVVVLWQCVFICTTNLLVSLSFLFGFWLPSLYTEELQGELFSSDSVLSCE